MIAFGIGGFFALSVTFGWRISLGFALGSVTAYINFRWLEKIVAGLGEAPSTSGRASARMVAARFLLRYFLMAAVAFVILGVSRKSLYGLFAGLFLPVAAILCEAAYEAYAALVRGL